MKNAYEKYTKIRAQFVPYLVRNSLHLCSVFLGEIMVLNIQYFEDRPQNRGLKKYNILRIILQIQCVTHNSVRIAHTAYFGAYSSPLKIASILRIVLKSEYGKYSKSCRRH